jgi:hypothetical protein
MDAFANVVNEVAGIGKLMEEADTKGGHTNAVAGGTKNDIKRLARMSK